MNKLFTVDRQRFTLWAQGTLLDRDAEGKCIVGDYAECEEAERRLKDGETITLTIQGKPVTTMKSVNNSFVEELIAVEHKDIEQQERKADGA